MRKVPISFPEPPKRVLVACTQRIGDVLLATPLARSVKSAWPDVHLDFLVLPGTQGVLEGNSDVNQVLVFAQRASLREKLAQLARIWRRYDLAFAATPSDRARIFAWAAAKNAVGFTTAEETSWLKRYLLKIAVPFDNMNTHTVAMGLQLLQAVGLPAIGQVQTPRVVAKRWRERLEQLNLTGITNYVVIHPSPKFRYKMWESAKWIALISWLRQQDVEVLLTGSGDPSETTYVREIASQIPLGCRCLAGLLSLAETAALMKSARLFVGPDTVVTHLAAAIGIPTIALFGPSNPVKWGPWPKDWPTGESPWSFVGSQQRGNVILVQGPGDCVPCLFEGCDRHVDSDSKCLQAISVERVVNVARVALAS